MKTVMRNFWLRLIVESFIIGIGIGFIGWIVESISGWNLEWYKAYSIGFIMCYRFKEEF